MGVTCAGEASHQPICCAAVSGGCCVQHYSEGFRIK